MPKSEDFDAGPGSESLLAACRSPGLMPRLKVRPWSAEVRGAGQARTDMFWELSDGRIREQGVCSAASPFRGGKELVEASRAGGFGRVGAKDWLVFSGGHWRRCRAWRSLAAGSQSGCVPARAGHGFPGLSLFDGECGVQAAQAVRTDTRDAGVLTELVDPATSTGVGAASFRRREQQIAPPLCRPSGATAAAAASGHFRATARGRSLAERNDQHLAVVIDVACDARADLALAQAHAASTTDRRLVAGLGLLHRGATEPLRPSRVSCALPVLRRPIGSTLTNGLCVVIPAFTSQRPQHFAINSTHRWVATEMGFP